MKSDKKEIPTLLSRHWYFVLSFSLSLLAAAFCYLVFRSGQYPQFEIGGYFFSGIPNYYFFFTMVLPFLAAGVVYLAFENKYIRFFGELSDDLDEQTRARLLRFRKILLLVVPLFSLLVVIQDAGEKSTALPPYAINLGDTANEQVARYFACNKKWLTEGCEIHLIDESEQPGAYLVFLKNKGFAGERVSGFDSFGHWSEQSSALYKFESFLSFLAAWIVSLLFAEVFLFMMVKNHVKPATKSLIIWMVVLASVWFPMKMFSSWYAHLGEYQTPAILWFAAALLVLGILLAIFLKTERNDLYKFASISVAVFSALMTVVIKRDPNMVQQAIDIIGDVGFIYSFIIFSIVMFSLYLVTDHFISNYEQEAFDKT